MIVLIFSLVLLLLVISLDFLNPGTFSMNFFGLPIRNIPISFFMLFFIVLGILLATAAFYLKYTRLKKRYASLLESIRQASTPSSVQEGHPEEENQLQEGEDS